MRIFIDESGGFGWTPEQISLHCAVIAPSSSLVELFRRHFAWKQALLGRHRKREVKANTLTDEQLEAFVRTVILPEDDLKIRVVGIDTRQVSKERVEKWRDGLSHLCQGAAEWSRTQGFPIAGRQYSEMSGWLWNRSAVNLALMISLVDVIYQSIQEAIIWFHEPQFEVEFDDFDILVDRGFIKERQHELFWREFLRTYLQNRSRRIPLAVPEEWKAMNHVFERTYGQGDNQLDLTPLFREHVYFVTCPPFSVQG